MRLSLLAALPICLRTVVAVFADEAWKTDYHYSLLGLPKEDTTFFHQPKADSKASLLYTLSEKGVLGAVNPKDGALVWRHQLAANGRNASNGFLRASDGQDVVVSGIGHEVAAWSAGDGRLAWSVDAAGAVKDVEILELTDSLATAGSKDAIALTSGDRAALLRLDGATGAVRWRYNIESTDTPFQASASSTEVFAILLHKTLLGYIKIRVISVDSVTGKHRDEYTLSSDSELATADNIISVGANSASPVIAWTDASYTTLKINLIGSKAVSTFSIEKHDSSSIDKISLHAPFHTNSLAHFLVHYETADSHWADVFHIDLGKNKISKAYSLPKQPGRGAFSTSVVDANVFFTRASQDEITTVSSSSHGVLGKWQVRGLKAAVGAEETDVWPVHAVSELSMKGTAVSAIRTAALLSTGDWVLLRDGSPQWLRPEALADIKSATFAASTAVQELAHNLEAEAHSNAMTAYVHRVTRHIADLQRLPKVLTALPQRFVRGFLGTSAERGMSNDAFGFHQIIACVTGNHRLIAIDAGSPNRIFWSRRIDVPEGEQLWHPAVSAHADVLTLDLGAAAPQLAFNATTGQSIPAVSERGPVIKAPDVEYTIKDGSLEAKRVGVDNPIGVWKFLPAKNEKVLSLVPRPVNDPVASIGKVLGDRRVLYKYLDPNLALLVTTNEAASSANVYVLETITGAILFSNAHTNVDLSSPIASIMSENWFAYSYTAESTNDSPKGHQLVVGEMFESLVPNDRGALQARANFSTIQAATEPFTLINTFQIPESLSKLAVTQTRQGITSRQLLAVISDSDAIVGIPYPVLDPRRPVGREPTKDEQMEGLMRYTSVVEFDPKWFLNHQREAMGIEQIITSPALIESTSLVFAYGLDVFGTRLSPSFSFDVLGRDFNKFQMLATVAALGVATVVVAPLVVRKQVDTRWLFT